MAAVTAMCDEKARSGFLAGSPHRRLTTYRIVKELFPSPAIAAGLVHSCSSLGPQNSRPELPGSCIAGGENPATGKLVSGRDNRRRRQGWGDPWATRRSSAEHVLSRRPAEGNEQPRP